MMPHVGATLGGASIRPVYGGFKPPHSKSEAPLTALRTSKINGGPFFSESPFSFRILFASICVIRGPIGRRLNRMRAVLLVSPNKSCRFFVLQRTNDPTRCSRRKKPPQ